MSVVRDLPVGEPLALACEPRTPQLHLDVGPHEVPTMRPAAEPGTRLEQANAKSEMAEIARGGDASEASANDDDLVARAHASGTPVGRTVLDKRNHITGPMAVCPPST